MDAVSNTSNSTPFLCDQSIRSATSILNFANYNILAPLRCLLAVSSHFIAFYAFKRQTKNDSGYAYQMYITVSKVIENVSYIFFVITTYHMAGTLGAPKGVAEFMSCYGCMWIIAHVSTTVQTALLVLSLLLSTAMAADRAFALTAPMYYRVINHKKHQIVALACCLVISVVTNVELTWRSTVQGSPLGSYTVVPDQHAAASVATVLVTNLKTGVRLLALVIMIISYVLILVNFEKRMKQVAQLTNQNSVKKQAERRRHQKTLFALVAFQLPWIILVHSMLAVNNILLLIAPQIQACQGALAGAVGVTSNNISDMLEVYVIFAFSAEFRRTVFLVAPGLKIFCVKSTVVVPVSFNQ